MGGFEKIWLFFWVKKRMLSMKYCILYSYRKNVHGDFCKCVLKKYGYSFEWKKRMPSMKYCTEKIEFNKLFWKNDNCSNLWVIFLLELNVVGCVYVCDFATSLNLNKRRGSFRMNFFISLFESVKIYFLTSKISNGVSITRAHLLCTDPVWKIPCFSTLQDYVHTIVCDW
jgi:hypothetical protein